MSDSLQSLSMHTETHRDRHIDAIHLNFFLGISTLIKRLDALNYSTIFYIFDESMSRDFDGDCDMAERLSVAYHKRIIFWPCPQMKVSGLNA